MKKVQQLLLLVLMSSFLLFSACSKEQETLGQDLTTEDTSTPEELEEEEPPTVTDDVPPAEGMVRSKVTNFWIEEELATSRPIAVMMPTDKEAQPQYGIGEAGVLYEIMEEGDISRQMAVIEDWQDMEKIGNVRSCRDYYLYAACEWDPILIHFGGVYYMTARLEQGDINNISGAAQDGSGPAPGSYAFFRSTDKSSPHNAYISGESILDAMDKLNYDELHRDQYYIADHFLFTTESNENTLTDYANAQDCNILDLSEIFPVSKSLLEYNPEDGLYYKSLHGTAQIDAITGDQLTFKNIIIQSTKWNYQIDNTYLHFDMCYSGLSGYYITNGKAIPITWTKTSDYAPTKYYDMSGNEIILNTGKTYIAVSQEGREPIIK